MKQVRRAALAWAVPLCAVWLACAPPATRAQDAGSRPRYDRPPRKVVVGTAVQSYWSEYPGLTRRLEQLAALVGQMAAESQTKYGRGLDLAVLPEAAVTGGRKGNAAQRSVAFAGPVQEAFAAMARKYRCYVVAPLELIEPGRAGVYYNAAVVVGRNGETVGTYRKIFPAVQHGSDDLEDGMSAGREAPVFACDFGRLGVQICFDMEFDRGWDELARRGAEIVAWPTQSPQTAHPAFRAMRHQLYVVSSNWRNNASVFEPTGKIAAQIKPPQQVLAEQIDLSYMILPWARQLRNGKALKERYGDRVGFRYYEDEDCGLFWSNDPALPIGAMAKSIGMTDWQTEHARVLHLFRKVHGRAPKP